MERIVVLTEVFPPQHGGSGRWFWELYSRVQHHDIHIYTDLNDTSCPLDNEFEGKVTRLNLSSPEWGLLSLIGLKFYSRSIINLYRYCKTHQITQIHSGRVLHEGMIGVTVAKLLGIKHLLFVHGEDIETTAVSREHDFMARQVFKYSEQAICNSQNSKNVMHRLAYVCPKVDVIHPGADANKFVPHEKSEGVLEQLGWQGRFVILTVGRLQLRKGQDKMIQALVALKESIPNVLYVIVGNGGAKAELVALTHQLGLDEFVHFKAGLSDIQMLECYQQCDVFILPNRSIGNDIEGFGMVLVEAQLCAKMVIAGDSGGTKEALRHEQTGLIVDCTEPSIIATSLKQLYKAPERMANMSAAARPFAAQSFDWEKHVKVFCEKVGL